MYPEKGLETSVGGTLFGEQISLKEVFVKAILLISMSESGSLNAPVRLLQPKKAPCSMIVTDSPKMSSEKLFPLNAKVPI